MSEQWLSIIEYARKYGISDMTIRRRIKTGRIKAVLRDGKYFIPASAANVFEEKSSFQEKEPFFSEAFPEKKDTFVRPEQYEIKKSLPTQFFDHQPKNQSSFSDKSLEKTLQNLEHQIRLAIESNEEKISLESKLYEEKIAHLKACMNQKEQTITYLQQKIEDYETLVNLLESKK